MIKCSFRARPSHSQRQRVLGLRELQMMCVGNARTPAGVGAYPALPDKLGAMAPLVALAAERVAELCASAGGKGKLGPTAEEATSQYPRQYTPLNQSSTRDVCRKIGSWHESKCNKPARAFPSSRQVAGRETFRVSVPPGSPATPDEEAFADGELLQRPPKRPSTPANFRPTVTPPVAPPQRRPSRNNQRTLRRAPATPRGAATAYGGPSPTPGVSRGQSAKPGSSAEGSGLSRPSFSGVLHSDRRSEVYSQTKSELPPPVPVKAATYHRTPTKTAGVLSKLLFRVTRPSGSRPESKERAFQSW